MKLLYIYASPRGEKSCSMAVAGEFVKAYLEKNPGTEIVTLDLFKTELPVFDRYAAEGKAAAARGGEPSERAKQAWDKIAEIVEEFVSADIYVFAVPMWNFGLPYVLKHYLDCVIQPGYAFRVGENGYVGLLDKKKVFVAYARGGVYASEEAAKIDFQRPHLRHLFKFMGIENVDELTVEGTMIASAEELKEKLDKARAEARALAFR